MGEYKYIYPPNARHQEQLDIMVAMEAAGKDPMALENLDQEVAFTTDYWYVTPNRFPYDGAEKQFLIVAKDEVYSLEEMLPEMWAELGEIWRRLVREYGVDGGGMCMRFGDPAKSGATLTRIHAHLIMPKEGEKVRFPLGGHTELKEGLHL